MSIFVDKNSRVLIQGITGREGRFHTKQCVNYGTNVVGGVTPGKGGIKIDDIPVFNTVREAKKELNPNCSIIFVPSMFAADAIIEAIDSKIGIIVCITEGIPVQEMLKIKKYIKMSASILIGPNCPGIITPGCCKIGIMPGDIHTPGGPIGVISRSGTLTYEVVYQLSKQGIGQSTCVGIGGDPIIGTNFIDCLREFQLDSQTKGIVMVGEIGGNDEEMAAEYIEKNISKPVVSFIAGITAPPGKRMGHAGAIVEGNSGTALKKIEILKKAGVHICEDLGNFGNFCKDVFC